MDKGGEWRALTTTPKKKKSRSFRIWAMLSYSPNVTWTDIADEFLTSSKSKELLKNFYNEVLARPFDEDIAYMKTKDLYDKREEYLAEVPRGVLVILCGADVQRDRIEVAVIGWGANYESWAIDYKIFMGDTLQPEVWDMYKSFITSKQYMNEDGRMVDIYGGATDAGYRTPTVTAHITPLFNRRFFSVMGASNVLAPISPHKASKTKNKQPLFMLGINKIKDEIAWYVKSEGGAGHMHHPIADIFGAEYFNQLGAEVRLKTGIWKALRKRNEVLDGWVYSRGMLNLLGIDLEILDRNSKQLGEIFPIQMKKRTTIKSHLDKY